MMMRTWKYGALAAVLALSFGCSSPKQTPPSVGSSGSPSSGSGGGSSTPGGTTTTIVAPSTPAATGTSSSAISVTWVDNSNNETGFNIYRSSTSNGTFVLVGAVAANTQLYNNTGLSSNTTYYYKITATDGTLESAATVEAAGTTLLNAAPSNLVADAISSSSIRLNWVDNSTSETSFIVERSFTSGAGAVWVTVATLPANTIRYTDGGLHPGNTYYYRVTAGGIVPAAISNTSYDTTFVGYWGEMSGSASGTGIHDHVKDGSAPSSAVDTDGIRVTVWEQNALGTGQIYMAIHDSSVLDDDGNMVGWKPAAVFVTVSEVTTDGQNNITGLKTTYRETSLTGGGVSRSASGAQKPKVVYDSTREEFYIVWQEIRNNKWEIVGRRMKARRSNIHYNRILEYYNVLFSDSTIASGNVAANNHTVDDSVQTFTSDWVLSHQYAAFNTDSMRPDIAVLGGALYAVWEEYITATRTWQIHGSVSTIPATVVYPNPMADVPAADTDPIDSVGASSDIATGISNAAATRHARLPSLAVVDATHVYVAWQSTDPVNGDWDISTNFCDGNNFSGAQVTVANAGNSQNPRIGADPAAVTPLPYLVWEDNSLNNRFNIYVLQGNAVGAVWSSLTANGITSGDTTTTGISVSGSAAQRASIAVSNDMVSIAWQDTSTNGISNLYVKRYVAQDTVPGEDAAWVSLGGSDTGSGLTGATYGVFLPELKSRGGDRLSLAFQGLGPSGRYMTFMLFW